MKTFFPIKEFWSEAIAATAMGMLAASAAFWLVHRNLGVHTRTELASQMEESLRAMEATITSKDELINWCRNLPKNGRARYTIIELSGNVVCDTYHDTESMDNHASRPEIAGAVATGWSYILRPSKTLGYELLYGAIRFETPEETLTLRKSIPLETIQQSEERSLYAVLLTLLPFLALLSGGSIFRSYRKMKPFTKIVAQAREFTQEVNPGELDGQQSLWEQLAKGFEAAIVKTTVQERQLRDEQSKLNGILESVQLPIFALDRDLNLAFSNREFRQWPHFEVKSIDLHSQSAPARPFVGYMEDVLQRLEPATLRAVQLKPLSETNYYDVSLYPVVSDDASSLQRVVVVLNDVTERHLLDQMRMDFVANASHELRTPVTALRSATELLSDHSTGMSQTQVKLSKAIARNVFRMSNLVRELLDLSRLESDAKCYPKVVSVREFSSELIQSMKLEGYEKQVERTKLQVEGASEMIVDTYLLQLIVSNLLGNAYKYAPESSYYNMRWMVRDTCCKIEIEDFGVEGIPESQRMRVFERFYRGRNRESGAAKGTGLGLAIVKHAARVHSGDVKLESRPGRTVFIVTIKNFIEFADLQQSA